MGEMDSSSDEDWCSLSSLQDWECVGMLEGIGVLQSTSTVLSVHHG